MISYQAYKVLHVIAVIVLFVSIGGLATVSLIAKNAPESKGVRRGLSIMHGVALFLILLGGFGLLARLGVSHGSGWPLWAYIKLGVWLALGASVTLIKRVPQLNKLLFLALPALGAVAIYSAIYKPL